MTINKSITRTFKTITKKSALFVPLFPKRFKILYR